MGQLSQRLGDILRSYGWDPAAWHGDLQSLAFLEGSDPKAAVERFHEMKRGFAAQRRADLLRALAAFPFARGVPPSDTRGMGIREVESEVRAALRSLSLAREAAAALAEAEATRKRLALRVPPPAPPLPEAPWDALAPVAEAAEAERRRVAREARLEERIADARRQTARLRHFRVEVPDLSSRAVPEPAEADVRLAPLEARLKALHDVEEAYEAACAPLRAAETREWRKESRKALEREAQALLALPDPAEAARRLRALQPRAEALRVEAAKLSSEAARARRSGRAPPAAERGPGDAMDPYA
jgi:hypothetical protein